MDYIKQIKQHLNQSGGIITAKTCREKNIPTVYLTRLVKQGFLSRAFPGIYVTESGDYDEFYFFQYQYQKSVYSYESALYLLGVTDKIPQIMEVTVISGYKFNRRMSGVLVHFVKKDWYELGIVETKTMFGNTVNVYSFERVLCDFIMNKKEVDPEIYVKTIRAYKDYDERNIQMLYGIASKMGISTKVRDIMEVAFE